MFHAVLGMCRFMTFNSEWHLHVVQNVNKTSEAKINDYMIILRKNYYYYFTEVKTTMARGLKKLHICCDFYGLISTKEN